MTGGDVPARYTNRFAEGREQWRNQLGLTRDTVRQALVSRQLRSHLAEIDGDRSAIRVLDAGCGQGTQALVLARAGFDVTGIDLSQELLTLADTAAAQEQPDVQRRVRFVRADLLTTSWPSPFDVVCCHGVAMYLPSLGDCVRALVRATCPGGLVSILTRNQAGIAMRAGMRGDWEAALAGFDATKYDNRIGIAGVRAETPEQVHAEIEACSAHVIAWYGVRLFTDHWENVEPPADVDALVAAEHEAGSRDPFRRLAALTHTVAQTAEMP